MTPGFTDREQRAIAAYVRHLADLMGLRDWIVHLMHDPPPVAEAAAMVRATYGRKHLSIWLARDFVEIDAETQRHNVVHELLHMVIDPITSIIANTAPELVSKPTYAVWWETIREREELAVDALAELVGPFLPLIDWTVQEDVERAVWGKEPEQVDPPKADPTDALT